MTVITFNLSDVMCGPELGISCSHSPSFAVVTYVPQTQRGPLPDSLLILPLTPPIHALTHRT